MHVACHCGQAFHIEARRYPHRVSCHVCGRRFLALEDGQTAAWDPGRSVHARCRCGHTFDAWTEQFPYQIHCHCGQRFSVLDTGETIGGEAPPVPIGVASVSIQSELGPTVVPSSTAVGEQAVAERLAADERALAPRTLDDELFLVDRQWQAERYRLRSASLLGVWMVLLLGGLLALICYFIFGGIAFVAGLFAIDLALIFKPPDGDYWQRYADAEAAWQRKRWEVVVKHARQMSGR